MIKTPGYVGIEDTFRLVSDGIEDGFDSILTATTWTKSVAIRLKACLPFWLESHFPECLLGSGFHRRHTKRALFQLSRLGKVM